MKHCPNESCHYFLETGLVAEYQEHVQLCPDCGSALEEGDAPIRERPASSGAATEASLFPDEWATVSAFDTIEGAEWLQTELRDAGIPAVIEESSMIESQADHGQADDLLLEEDVGPDHDDADPEANPERDGALTGDVLADAVLAGDVLADDALAYEVRVMAGQTVAAMDLLRTLVDDEEAESGAEAGDWAEEDSTLDPEWDGAEYSLADGDEIDDGWGESDLGNRSNNLITNPIVVLFILFCVLLAIAYLIFVGFPAGL